MDEREFERLRDKRRAQVGTALLMCTASTLTKCFELLLDDLQEQIEEAQEDGADDDDYQVRLWRSTIAASFISMKEERIKPTAAWKERFDVKIAASKQRLQQKRASMSAAQRKLKSNRAHEESEAQLKASQKKTSEPVPPEKPL